MASKYSKVNESHYSLFKECFQNFVVYIILYPILKVLFRIEVQGKENIPQGCGIIAASNHTSYFDPPVLAVATKRLVAFMAKEELFHVPVLSPIIQALGAFSVNRGKLEIATIKSAKHVLSKTKWWLGIFPEGTRVKGNKIGKINSGFGYLAKSTGSKVLPVGIVINRSFCPIFGKMIVRIGKPIEDVSNPEELMDKWAEAVAALTGKEYDRDFSFGNNSKKEVSEQNI